jgi:hypothetical protein
MGERVNVEELKSRVVPAILSGTRRDTGDELLALGPDREHAVLNALSLGGQILRFARPPVPREFTVESWPHDQRRIIPGRMRSKIARLLDRCTEDTARALALAFEKQGLRPHPFDLPKLDGFVRRYAERLGTTAQYWMQRDTPAQQSRGFFDAEELTSENWSEGSLRKRLKFLTDLRKRDPKAARELLEKSWPAEIPDSRVHLLSILQIELAADDKPFLESIQKDRAPRVRAIVQKLIGNLSGERTDNPALARCMERIQKSKTGLLKKRAALKLELPATVKEHETNRWIQEQFAEVTLDEFAHACELTEAAIVEAAEKDNNLLFALALMASREGRIALLRAISDEIPDAWGRMSELNEEDPLLGNSEDHQEWAQALIRPKKWLPEIPFPAWSWLHRQMEGPLPADIMREILASGMWAEQLNGEKKGPSLEIIQVICALSPPELRGSLRTHLEPLEVERKDKGLMLLEILDELESLT